MKFYFLVSAIFLSACIQPIKLGTSSLGRPPTVDLSAIGNQILQEDSDPLSIPFRIGGKHVEPEKTIFQTISSDTKILETPEVSHEQETGDYILKLTPVPNKHGKVTVTVRVNNGFEDQRKEISVEVEPINDLPIVYAPAEVKFKVGEITKNEISFNLTDVESHAEDLTTTFQITQEALFEPGAFSLDPESQGRNRKVLINKPPRSPGSGFLKIFAKDTDGGVGLFSVHIVVERAQNQGPQLLGIPESIRIPAGEKSVTLSANFSDDTSTPNGLSFSVFSSTPEVISNNNILISGTGYKRDVIIQTQAEKKGKGVVIFELSDGKSKVTQKLDVEVY
jgi:hypothetical protein